MQRAEAYFGQVDAILEAEAAADPALSGMGTTMTMVYLLDRDLLVAHVGDSRAYRYRDGTLSRLTQDQDQSMAQALADASMTAEEVKSHRQRHILTGALGARRELRGSSSGATICATATACWWRATA